MTNAPSRKVALLAPALCLALLLIAPIAAPAAGTIVYEHEGQQAFEQQLARHEIASATFNKELRSLHLELKDGRHVLYKYPKGTVPQLKAKLESKGVPVSVLSKKTALKEIGKKPVHHKLRYIAGGILIAVIVIVGGVLLVDRRRKAAMD